VRRKYAAAPAAARLAAIAARPVWGIGVAGSHGRLASGAESAPTIPACAGRATQATSPQAAASAAIRIAPCAFATPRSSSQASAASAAGTRMHAPT
jgi:hypothetical protein